METVNTDCLMQRLLPDFLERIKLKSSVLLSGGYKNDHNKYLHDETM